MHTTCIFIFTFYASQREKAKILGLFTFAITVFAVVGCISLFALNGQSRMHLCEFATTIVSTLAVSPRLYTIISVIKSKRVASMPLLWLLVVNLLCDVSWLMFGVLSKTRHIYHRFKWCRGWIGHSTINIVLCL